MVRPLQEAFEKEHGSVELKENQKIWKAKLKEIRSLASGQSPPGYGPTTMSDAQHKDGKNARQIVKWLDEKAYGDQPF
ncbi:MAG: hypothetical protein ACKVH8_20980 [Pirellulales bacterium]